MIVFLALVNSKFISGSSYFVSVQFSYAKGYIMLVTWLSNDLFSCS